MSRQEENILDSGLCIFHDENYLKDPENMEANKQNIKRKLTEKIEKPEPLICIGYQLPKFSFEKLHFNKSVNFLETVFVGPANFSGAEFKSGANFSSAKFKSEANFSRADFTNVIFISAQFLSEQFDTDFIGAKFIKARFSFTKFTRYVIFSNARFTGDTFFTEAQFVGGANFYAVQFHESVGFSDAKFGSRSRGGNKTIFSHSKFIKEATFARTIFTHHSDFNNVLFRDPENTIFQTDNLSQVSFMKTEISRIIFGENVRWGPDDRPKRTLKNWWYRDKKRIQNTGREGDREFSSN